MRIRILLLISVPALASASVWPETMGQWTRSEVKPATVADRPIWDEYGLKEAETATFTQADRRFTAAGYRLQDPTGALAAFQWQRPAGAGDSKLAPLAAETTRNLLAVHGNFLFVFEGYKPSAEEFAALAQGLRNVDTTALPAFASFLPAATRLPGTERFILGPASLEKFSPGIPPSVAAFSMGAEAQLASFRSPKGEMRLALFNYPTPQIAQVRIEEFQKVTGVMAKRSGPLVAAIVSPPDADAAERLLAEIRYEAQITMSEHVPTQRDNVGNLIINAFILIGMLLGFAIVAGLAFGGVRVLRRLVSKGPEPEPMIMLHLENR